MELTREAVNQLVARSLAFIVADKRPIKA